ncbi:serine hydrolase [Alphaproteobacteria bacterium KMM 3653]|uniref:Serine hydrolase n=1 Tax=Harenicola maris TaxID=2841044 RepID=A0AAP2CT08_9RHOB|nr:serine hydrolase [Harenicola maris]
MADLTASIDAHCAAFLRPNGPGLALAMLQDGAVTYRKAFGLANLEHQIPIGFDSVFECASVSKQVTGLAVHLLAQDGKLTLSDPIRQHLPELPDICTPITIAQCLHHTCGLRDWTEAMGFAGLRLQDVVQTEHVYRWLLRQSGVNHAPGAEHFYCNTGYLVLAKIVERISGESFAAFCHTRIFAPLGMSNTHFREDLQAVIPHRVDSYYRRDDGTFLSVINAEAAPGATSLQSTLDDLCKLVRNYDSAALGGAELIADMHRHGRLGSGEEIPYGSGIELTRHRGEDIAWHTGGWACFATLTLRMPAKGIGLVLLSNSSEMQLSEFWPPIVDILLGGADPAAQTAPEPRPLDVPLSDLAGTYYTFGGAVIEMTLKGDALHSGPLNGEGSALIPLGGLRLCPKVQPETVIEFTRNAKGAITGYSPRSKGVTEPFRQRLHQQEITAPLSDYTGTYYSHELEIGVRIEIQDGTLTASTINHGDEPYTPLAPDLFMEQDDCVMREMIRFLRNTQGRVTGLEWSSIDARAQFFTRIT